MNTRFLREEKIYVNKMEQQNKRRRNVLSLASLVLGPWLGRPYGETGVGSRRTGRDGTVLTLRQGDLGRVVLALGRGDLGRVVLALGRGDLGQVVLARRRGDLGRFVLALGRGDLGQVVLSRGRGDLGRTVLALGRGGLGRFVLSPWARLPGRLLSLPIVFFRVNSSNRIRKE
ncbi:hypothetical protein Bca4012_058820 [Brassica carinata]